MSRHSSMMRNDGEGTPLLHSGPEYDPLGPDDPGGQKARSKVEKRLLRKLDIRMSILVVIYILNYVDRNSAAAARLRGFEDELGLEGTQFASILSIFYVGYIFMQIPSNMLLSQIGRPSVYLSSCMIGWGAISFCTGFVNNYHGALLTRFLLGFVEAAFYPGALFLITKWYKRSELSQRMAFLSCGSLFSNAFGSLIASGILDVMDGACGYTAWRWLFFVEGGLTVFVAILALFILPDFPETESIRWLTPAEHALARRRIAEDAGVSHGEPSRGKTNGQAIKGFITALADWKVWYLAFTTLLMVISSSFFMYFPTLASTMGYNPTITLLLCAPPWLLGALWALWISRRSDRTDERCIHTVVSLAIGVGGFLLAMSTMNTTIRYTSLFLMALSDVASITFIAWVSLIVPHPPAKRAVAIAFTNAFSQSGNVVGSYIWPKSWGPSYNKSYGLCMMTSLLCIAMCLWLRRALERFNKEMDSANEQNQGGANLDGKGWRYHL